MKALVLAAYNQLEYKDVPDPVPGPEEVLVQVKACGICGSDVHGLDGRTGRRLPPIIMGHEAAGVIAALGDGVSAWKVGDRVTFDSTIYCGRCYYCRRGLVNLCDSRNVLGVSCEEFRRDGAFAEYIAVPARVVYALPEGISFEQAAMVEPFAVACHAVNLVPITLNDSAVVIGAGVIGLSLVQALRAAGCGLIVAADVDETRLELARRLGADHAANPATEDVPAVVRRLTDGRGADVAFEAVGVTATVQLAAQSLRKGGALGLVGNVSPSVELPLQTVVTRELALYGSCISRGEYPDCLAMMARGQLDPDPMISAVAPLSEGAAWFERLRQREPGLVKVMLRP
jgi:threonine dehydrogenase-like Zn-dependent dehydrogenase